MIRSTTAYEPHYLHSHDDVLLSNERGGSSANALEAELTLSKQAAQAFRMGGLFFAWNRTRQ
jgi:hypothetical protein